MNVLCQDVFRFALFKKIMKLKCFLCIDWICSEVHWPRSKFLNEKKVDFENYYSLDKKATPIIELVLGPAFCKKLPLLCCTFRPQRMTLMSLIVATGTVPSVLHLTGLVGFHPISNLMRSKLWRRKNMFCPLMYKNLQRTLQTLRDQV